MSPRLEYLFGILIVIAALECIIHAQDDSAPVKVNDKKNTKGLVGTIQGYLSPVSNVLLEYINSALIHIRGEQLPCTIFSLVDWKFACTKITAGDESSDPMSPSSENSDE